MTPIEHARMKLVRVSGALVNSQPEKSTQLHSWWMTTSLPALTFH